MFIKTLFIIWLQLSTQYALYNEHRVFIGNLSIYEDNLYLKVTGYLPDTFKIKFTSIEPTCIIYYIENDTVKGSVIIYQSQIHFDVLINNQIHESHKFYRNIYENWHK